MEQARDLAPDQDETRSRGLAEVGPDTASTDVRSILQLQRMAGNRAVDGLLRGGPRSEPGRRELRLRMAVQRFWGDEELGPTEEPPIEDDFVPPPIQWPSEAEGERNEPCFTPESQTQINDGAAQADVAASHLFAGPPDLASAVKEAEAALEIWEQTAGAEPGQGMLNDAKAKLGGAGSKVSIYVTPVKDMLETLSSGTQQAVEEADIASDMMQEPEKSEEYVPPEEAPLPEPCFEDRQKSIIAEGIALADVATTELEKRPPDYRKALQILKEAATTLEGVGGYEPGEAKLKGAVSTLRRIADVVDAYLTPVEEVVSRAAQDLQDASAIAREASEASIRGRYAPGQEPPPGQGTPGGYAPPPGMPPAP